MCILYRSVGGNGLKLLTVDTIEGAAQKLLEAIKGKTIPTEKISLQDACGRILAEDIISSQDQPAFNRSTVDGYAVKSSDTHLASESIPVFLTRVGEVEMGKTAGHKISKGECVYVPTGGMLPEGADAMVMVEYCEPFGENGLSVSEAVSPGRYVIPAGDDAKKGEVVLPKGTLIRPLEIGVLASLGVIEPLVYKAMDMTLISIGDELVHPGEEPEPGKIRDINTYTISALAAKYGLNIIGTHLLADDENKLKYTIESAMKESDLVVVSGGSSQGIKDATAKIIGQLASKGLLTHGLAIKPGKPTIISYDEITESILIGLPGHPVSAMMVFDIIMEWLLDYLTIDIGLNKNIKKSVTYASIDRNVPGAAGKDTLQMVKLSTKDSQDIATPVYGKSGNIIKLSKSDGYVVIPRNKEGITEGERVEVHLF